VAVAQSVYFAHGLKATEFFFVLVFVFVLQNKLKRQGRVNGAFVSIEDTLCTETGGIYDHYMRRKQRKLNVLNPIKYTKIIIPHPHSEQFNILENTTNSESVFLLK
jgi:hypothetical protein